MLSSMRRLGALRIGVCAPCLERAHMLAPRSLAMSSRGDGGGSSSSPFAPPLPSSDGATMSKEEEQKQRIEAMAEVMREKTMREAESAGASRRPDGVKHLLDLDKDEGAVDRAMREALPQYAANYDEDRDEWGGPKGEEPTRFGDWERNGRATDF